jgi:hypothetical protein
MQPKTHAQENFFMQLYLDRMPTRWVLAGRGESRCRNVGTALEGSEWLPEGPSVAWESCKDSKRVVLLCYGLTIQRTSLDTPRCIREIRYIPLPYTLWLSIPTLRACCHQSLAVKIFYRALALVGLFLIMLCRGCSLSHPPFRTGNSGH